MRAAQENRKEAKGIDYYDSFILCGFINLSYFYKGYGDDDESRSPVFRLINQSDAQEFIPVLNSLLAFLQKDPLQMLEDGNIELTEEQLTALVDLRKQMETCACLVKTLRNDERFFADRVFFPSITKNSDDTRLKNPPLRRGAHRRFTVTVNTAATTPEERDTLYAGPYEHRPKTTHPRKTEFSKWQATSLVFPGVQTSIFGFNKDRRGLGMAGVLFDPTDKNSVITQRLWLYDGGTVSRPYETVMLKEIEQRLAKYSNGKMFGDMDTFKKVLCDPLNKDKNNEVFARLKWSCAGSAVAIFQDDFESRCLAQYFASQIENQLKRNGVLGYQAPILFSIEGHVKNLTIYPATQKLKDREEANAIFTNASKFAEAMLNSNYNFLFLLDEANNKLAPNKEFHGRSLLLYLVEMGRIHIARHIFKHSGLKGSLETFCASELKKFEDAKFLYPQQSTEIGSNPGWGEGIYYLPTISHPSDSRESKDLTPSQAKLLKELPVGSIGLQLELSGDFYHEKAQIHYFYRSEKAGLLKGTIPYATNELLCDNLLWTLRKEPKYFKETPKLTDHPVMVSYSVDESLSGSEIQILLITYMVNTYPSLFPLSKSFDGDSLLGLFAEKNEVEFIKAWDKVSPLYVSEFAHSALIKAIQIGSRETIICLLELHPELVEKHGAYDCQYLDLAAIEYQRDTEITHILLDHYEHYLKSYLFSEVKDDMGDSLVLKPAVKAGFLTKIKHILHDTKSQTASEVKDDRADRQILRYAIRTGILTKIKKILKDTPKIITLCNDSNDPLFRVAIENAHYQTSLFLIDSGARWDFVTGGGDTFVHQTVEHCIANRFSADDIEMIFNHILTKKAAGNTNITREFEQFLNIKNQFGESAVLNMVRNVSTIDDLKVLRVLFIYGADISNCINAIDGTSPYAENTRILLERMQTISELKKICSLDIKTNPFGFHSPDQETRLSDLIEPLNAMLNDISNLHNLVLSESLHLQEFVEKNSEILMQLIDASQQNASAKIIVEKIKMLTTKEIFYTTLQIEPESKLDL